MQLKTKKGGGGDDKRAVDGAPSKQLFARSKAVILQKAVLTDGLSTICKRPKPN
ncbi:hypothetical protein ACRALDRAFT_213720 [Sodiomyces alcalophilus JCM 7366]|uniref:uncharacterized protein n=1 Tax=Sodiomyces alcalophilus JCM 7366 TaxID=591952 RepID=UPI0039B6607C